MTLEDLIIEMMPFSDELKIWCKKYHEFTKALKIIYPERFINLGGVITSHHPGYSEEEIIGAYTYDYKREKFIQDFIVNKNNEIFILYTRNPKGNSKYVKDINDFFLKYGKGVHYLNVHHSSLQDLPDEIKPRAIAAIKIAEKIKQAGYVRPTQEQIDKTYQQLSLIKSGQWFLREKLK